MPILTLDVPATATYGAAVPIKALMPEKSIQFTGLSGSTLQVEGSNDNASWAQLGSDVTVDGFVAVTTPAQFLRLRATVRAGDTPVAVLCGLGVGYTS